jgi:hypothetical protein
MSLRSWVAALAQPAGRVGYHQVLRTLRPSCLVCRGVTPWTPLFLKKPVGLRGRGADGATPPTVLAHASAGVAIKDCGECLHRRVAHNYAVAHDYAITHHDAVTHHHSIAHHNAISEKHVVVDED